MGFQIRSSGTEVLSLVLLLPLQGVLGTTLPLPRPYGNQRLSFLLMGLHQMALKGPSQSPYPGFSNTKLEPQDTRGHAPTPGQGLPE